MTAKLPDRYVPRKAEIVAQFKQVLDNHLTEFLAGRVNKMPEMKEIANILCLNPVYLSQTIKIETGHQACYLYEQRILVEEKKLLADPSLSIKMIANKMDYDASNFTKFFKRFMNITPPLYRKHIETNANLVL